MYSRFIDTKRLRELILELRAFEDVKFSQEDEGAVVSLTAHRGSCKLLVAARERRWCCDVFASNCANPMVVDAREESGIDIVNAFRRWPPEADAFVMWQSRIYQRQSFHCLVPFSTTLPESHTVYLAFLTYSGLPSIHFAEHTKQCT